MNNIPKAPPWGFFTLVTYIPDPLGSFLEELRDDLPGSGCSQVHITLLPPRVLKVPIEAASTRIQGILSGFPQFQVELHRVRRFAETNFLYLDLNEGDSVVEELHAALNTGALADPEKFEFSPHLTLGGPVLPADLDSAQQQVQLAWDTRHCSPRFTIREVVFLWASPESPQGEWGRLWSHQLKPQERAAAATVTSQTSSTARRDR